MMRQAKHKTGSREAWLAARLNLLKAEKDAAALAWEPLEHAPDLAASAAAAWRDGLRLGSIGIVAVGAGLLYIARAPGGVG